MELKEASLSDVQRENPALVTSIKEAVIKEINESAEQKKKDAEIKELKEKSAKYELKEKQDAQGAKIDAWLKENASKDLPEIAKNRIKKNLMASIIEDEAKLKEAFTAVVTEELLYLKQIGGKGKIKISENKGAAGTSALQEAEGRLGGRMNLAEDKENGE